ncbi:MAG: acyl-CoA dehydratase activase [Candidatus Bipolaricaulia bacterium]
MESKTISFPHIGNYSYRIKRAVEAVCREEGIEHLRWVIPPPTTKKTILKGWQLMDENMCLPAKITLGNDLDVIETEDVDTILMFDSCGTCRYKAYHKLHQSILADLGYQTKMRRFRTRQIVRDIMDIDPAITRKVAVKIIWRGLKQILEMDKKVFEKQARLPAPGDPRPKIGIVGEIYTILDPHANMDLLRKLEKAGAFVHNSLPLSEFVFKQIYHNRWLSNLLRFKRPDMDYKVLKKAEQEAERYYSDREEYDLGGHGVASIVHTIYYAKMGFDAVVHVQPFPCMPESTVTHFMDRISEDYQIPVNHLTFDQQFGEANLNTRVEALVNMVRIRKQMLSAKRERDSTNPVKAILKGKTKAKTEKYFLGIDVGSVSTKGAIIDQDVNIINWAYLDTARDPIQAVRQLMAALKTEVPVHAVATTGSGRRLASVLVGADLVVDEITCQTLGCLYYVPGARSIIEIGGQDSKFIQIDEIGVPIWFNLNTICSAGTGSFFAGAAREFGVPIEKFGEIAVGCPEEVNITGRCGVFAESDIVTKQQQGYRKEALIKGLCMAMPLNFLNNVARNRELVEPIVFTGGVASNDGAVLGFERALGKKVEVLEHNKISGCIGAALIAMANWGGTENGQTKFFGFEVADFDYVPHGFLCQDCPNNCEISLVLKGQEVWGTFGSRCRKWEALVGKQADERMLESKDWHPLLEQGGA